MGQGMAVTYINFKNSLNEICPFEESVKKLHYCILILFLIQSF